MPIAFLFKYIDMINGSAFFNQLEVRERDHTAEPWSQMSPQCSRPWRATKTWQQLTHWTLEPLTSHWGKTAQVASTSCGSGPLWFAKPQIPRKAPTDQIQQRRSKCIFFPPAASCSHVPVEETSVVNIKCWRDSLVQEDNQSALGNLCAFRLGISTHLEPSYIHT